MQEGGSVRNMNDVTRERRKEYRDFCCCFAEVISTSCRNSSRIVSLFSDLSRSLIEYVIALKHVTRDAVAQSEMIVFPSTLTAIMELALVDLNVVVAAHLERFNLLFRIHHRVVSVERREEDLE